MRTAIGIDIGGTKTRIALISSSLTIIQRFEFPTETNNPETTLNRLEKIIADFSAHEPVGIGLSCPGPLDLKQGRIITTFNLGTQWHGYPLSDRLAQRTGLPVILENDANLAALAEAVIGAGKTNRFVQYLTVSTGIGCALVIDGHLFHGAHGFANEVANVIVRPNGPTQGTLLPGSIEALASGTAIVRRARQAGLIANHAGDVKTHALSGNTDALRIIDDAETALSNFIAALIAVNDPDIVILGGSVALKTPSFIENVTAQVREKVTAVVKPFVNIQPAALNDDSGLIGAAVIVFKSSDITS